MAQNDNNSVAKANEHLARRINQQARSDPNSQYAGKFVGIANGRVVIVADSLKKVSKRLRALEPDPHKCFCLEASADYDTVEEIWSVY